MGCIFSRAKKVSKGMLGFYGHVTKWFYLGCIFSGAKKVSEGHVEHVRIRTDTDPSDVHLVSSEVEFPD